MANIVSYLAREQRTFEEEPFNVVDGLVMATLAYLRYERYDRLPARPSEPFRLHDVLALASWRDLLAGSWMRDAADSRSFLRALMASRRYRDAFVSFYVSESSDAVEKQFSAITLTVGDGCVYLAFRGTDGSLAGWKEDFNLCFMDVTPSQQAAVAYVSGVASALPGRIVLTGHSKGGNLAQYAALCVASDVYGRITRVCNYDGPSFLGDPSPRVGDSTYRAMLFKAVPESSLFGMILEDGSDYHVVQSSAMLIFQHEPFSWLVSDGDFLYRDGLTRTALWADGTLDGWLKTRTPEQRAQFIDTIYDFVAASGVKTAADLHRNFGSIVMSVASSTAKLDPETRAFILDTFKALVGVVGRETAKSIDPRTRIRLPRRRESYDGSRPADFARSLRPAADGSQLAEAGKPSHAEPDGLQLAGAGGPCPAKADGVQPAKADDLRPGECGASLPAPCPSAPSPEASPAVCGGVLDKD